MSELATKYSDEKSTYAGNANFSEEKEENSLKRDLTSGQISMIAIGGAIGTGLV